MMHVRIDRKLRSCILVQLYYCVTVFLFYRSQVTRVVAMLRMTGSHALVLFGVAVTAILLQGPTVLAVRSVQDQYIYWSDPRVDIPSEFGRG